MLKKPATLFLLLFSCVLFFNCSNEKELTSYEKEWLKNNPDLNVGVFSYYPPYLFTNDKGNIDGVLIDYLDIIEQKLSYTFKKTYYTNWQKLLDDAKAGKVDIILEITDTENRRQFLNFTPAVFVTPYSIIANKKVPWGTPLKKFKDKKIVVVEGYSVHEYLDRNYKDYNIFTAPNDSTALAQVYNGTYDAYIGLKTSTKYLLKMNEWNSRLKVIHDIDYDFRQSIATRKDIPILNDIITKTIQLTPIEEKEIIDAWFYTMITPFYMEPAFWIFVSLFIAISLIVILFLNSLLKYRVNQKTKELVDAKDKAEESDRLKTQFLQNISHEIRTPMNGIIGFTDIINNYDISENERKKYINLIADSSKLLIKIIDDILEISELKTKQANINISRINLNQLLDFLFSIYETKASQNNIPLYLEKALEDDACYIFSDEKKLKSILSNMIENAIKFTKKGFIKISYTIENNQLLISVQDTGIGIRDKNQQKIFNSFTQEEKELNKSYGGLGIGLSIAKENVELLNGTISFTSQEGIGSTFLISLPYPSTLQRVNTAPIVIEKYNPNLEHFKTKNKRIILIAEDGEVNFLYLKTILNKMTGYDFTIHRAKNGKDAVELCKTEQNIDLVLMDIKMPIMDGYDATKYIKKLRPDLPIIAQTAYTTKDDIDKALSAGCDDFVAKPVDRNILKPMIQKHIL
ncbi:response regulator [Aquimarina rhabdastrellae]